MWRIPLSDLNYDDAEREAVDAVLRTRWLSMGPRTEEFEAAVAGYLGARHALAVSNCTCALEMAYRVLGHKEEPSIGAPGFRALVPALTFVATANAALLSGGQVEFADIVRPETPLMGAEEVALWLDAMQAESNLPCIVAPVHYGGFGADMEGICRVAAERGARVLEDAAHGIGARSAAGRSLGTEGDLGCFSFFSNKNLATGEGGLIVTDDDEIAARLRLLRSHGMTSLTWQRHSTRSHGYDVVAPGHNYRITEITAALALVQLSKLDAGNARRRRLYRLYRDGFLAEPRLCLPFGDSDEAIDRSACHILPLLCPDEQTRNRIRTALTEAGIQTSHHYPPVHQFTYYRAAQHDASRARSCSRTELYSAREVTLPLHPNLSETELEEVVSVVLRTMAGIGNSSL